MGRGAGPEGGSEVRPLRPVDMAGVNKHPVKLLKPFNSFCFHTSHELILPENKVDSTNRCEALKEVMSLNYV